MPDPVTTATNSSAGHAAASLGEVSAVTNERFAATLNGSLNGLLNGSLNGSLNETSPHATVSLGAMVGARTAGSAASVGLGAMVAARRTTGLAAIGIDGATPTSASSSTALTASTPESRQVAAATNFALAQLGKPYVFGTAGPDTFDCSGLVSAAYKQAGIDIPAYTFTQATYGRPIDPATEPIRPGDLIFVRGGRPAQDLGHVGMAISATEWVQAPHTGDVVKVGPLPYDRIQVVRRLAG